MIKPVMKREVATTTVYEEMRLIYFYTTADAVTEFVEFGSLCPDIGRNNVYILIVDARFDFQEVLDYLNSYG